MIAITRIPSTRMNSCELTFIDRGRIDIEQARFQHQKYCRQLERCGCSVETIEADDSLADCAFVEDTAIVFDDIAIISRPHQSRIPELGPVREILEQHRSLRTIEAPGKMEGGDVLRVGNQVFVGQSTRTNRAGTEQLGELLREFDLRVIPIDVQGCLHFKTACTAVDDQTLLVNPDWVNPSRLEGFDWISVPPEEPFAANLLRIGPSILVPKAMPLTEAMLRRRGYQVTTVDTSEFSKAEAGLTCLSLIFSTVQTGQGNLGHARVD